MTETKETRNALDLLVETVQSQVAYVFQLPQTPKKGKKKQQSFSYANAELDDKDLNQLSRLILGSDISEADLIIYKSAVGCILSPFFDESYQAEELTIIDFARMGKDIEQGFKDIESGWLKFVDQANELLQIKNANARRITMDHLVNLEKYVQEEVVGAKVLKLHNKPYLTHKPFPKKKTASDPRFLFLRVSRSLFLSLPFPNPFSSQHSHLPSSTAKLWTNFWK
eukprot:TRINITY_DN2268_c0_g1_i2.p1 TRINITY_DN2268_c0_g1~~TRINITY_DN2268_c0_g1_i2.p1  ORF type:complete len:233 (+),score=52.76 TRINITY_DN2268_c0_g1_i2:26-700(+)